MGVLNNSGFPERKWRIQSFRDRSGLGGREIYLHLTSGLLAVALEQRVDLLHGVDDVADGLVVVQSVYDIRQVLAHVDADVPFAGVDGRVGVYEVRREDPVEQAVPVGLVELVGLVAFL